VDELEGETMDKSTALAYFARNFKAWGRKATLMIQSATKKSGVYLSATQWKNEYGLG
jgi:hypothetical protein